MSTEVINLDSINRQHNDLDTSQYDLSDTRSGKVKRIVRFVCTKVCAGIIILGIISIVIICVAFLVSYENDAEVTLTVGVLKKDLSSEQDFWFDKALDDLEDGLNTPINSKKAQNIILFVADGFDPDAISSARIRHYGTNGSFAWERFPHVGVVRWNKRLAVGTGMFGGVGAHSGTSGLDSSVFPDDCLRMDDDRTHVESILSWAQQLDLKTGLITNGDLRRGSSVALYAHIANNSWACPSMLPDRTQLPGCLDAETQLRFNEPGKKLNVIMGWDTLEEMCDSEHTLKMSWKDDGYSIAEAVSDFLPHVIDDDTEYVRALLPGTLRRGIPLQTMITKSLQILTEDSDGFILVVMCEPVSKIDEGVDIIELEEAVKTALSSLGSSMEDTLMITTFTPVFSNQQDNTKDETKDSIIYAIGPMAHLFRNLHDPTYIAHVISYAARLGRFRDSLLANSLLQWF
ncbi:AAEL000196-PA [Aedes aegypti]|uniref:alkaline phosphatase n=2 Tax=Aedes aegypti TaxID=7159 RepID=A0A1S4EV76_AEDAE|nr:alkaline phosphatase, tissue-nonspecific isozyme [Aedes aegypti]EAT48832.1 AAEL000196-PA [Aedes aegypti]